MSEKEIIKKFEKILSRNNIDFKKEVPSNGYRADIVLPLKNIAIEAKLFDIKKAIRQSFAYSLDYKNVYILLPQTSYSLVQKYKEELRKLKIKWCFLQSDNSLKFGHYSWRKILLG